MQEPGSAPPAAVEEAGAGLRGSWLHKVTQEPPLGPAPQPALPLAVVAVERYLGEGPGAAVSPPACPQYHYDVTLADSACQRQCHLAPPLHRLVQRGALRAGCQVRVMRCFYLYEERQLGHGFLCLEQLEVVGDLPAAAPGWRAPPAESHRLPLKGGRKHFLPLWNNEDPYGDLWVVEKPPGQVDVEASKLISLGHLEMSWRNRIHFRPLLVRIMHKSRLRYYGKPDKRLDVPYQAYFEVADSSGMMSMVLWNSLCPEWYNSMKVGTVLLLEQYAIKTSYPFKTQPTPGDSQMKRFATIEISLNVRDPPTKITVVPESMVKPEWRLPEVKYRFITRSELDNLPNSHSCDVIGLVTFVGRSERTKKKEHGEDFWTSRWVHVIDGTSNQPFILELFATSQPDVFEHIHPMMYLVCTQMRVVRNNTEHPLPIYLTTSNESQIFITGWHKGQPYTKDTKVKNFIRWIKTQNEADQMKKTVIVESVLKTISEMERELEDLHYREHRRFAIQGIISVIRYVSCSSAAQDASGVEPVQPPSKTTVKDSKMSEEDHVNKGKDRKYEDREVPNSRCAPLEQHHHAAVLTRKSPVKRKIMHCLEVEQKRDVAVPVSSCPYFTRSARKKGCLDEFHQEDSMYENVRLAVPDVSESCTDKEGRNDTPEIEETGRTCDSWQSDLWTRMKDKLTEHLHHSTVFPESIPHKFDYKHKDFLLQQYNLHPAKHKPKEYKTNMESHDFSSTGHYEVTILGINHDVAIDIAFLPLLCPEYPHLFQMENIQNDALLSCMNCISVQQQETTSNERPCDLSPLSDEIVKAAADLDKQHVICILDICHLGEDKVEVFLSKIYKITEPGVVTPV
uniref:RPA1 related single stranded DNA binding protein, X-linked n=1 Tax=Crocodylus porosus TaxID=8502 RepID=A0A7M4EED1_CROPO